MNEEGKYYTTDRFGRGAGHRGYSPDMKIEISKQKAGGKLRKWASIMNIVSAVTSVASLVGSLKKLKAIGSAAKGGK